MSETATSNLNENTAQPALLSNQGEIENEPSSVLGVQEITEDERSPAATSPNEQKAQSETGLNETLLQLQLLRILTRDLPDNKPKPASNNDEEIRTLRKKLFGLTRTESNNVNNRFDYEQKYPADRPGEELGPSARVWSTYLDEAEAYDRERAEGWKETADVLLVFAGLFSSVVATFVSQASQSLQQDNTQVSASLLFETNKLLRAQFSGTPINNVPSSILTPTSPFIPSANAQLVNGLWFTSLALTLSTALFAVLSKQWLYYYLSSISGTPREKARARQFRFQGFESWKVGAIVDLLPILLHIAVGMFLTGIIILLFPLDVQVARAIVAITGVTYVLYFVSVILPVRYPGCPYVTSLTIYIGVLFFFLPRVTNPVSKILRIIDRVYPSSQLDPEVCSKMARIISKWNFFQKCLLLFLCSIWVVNFICIVIYISHGRSALVTVLLTLTLLGDGFVIKRLMDRHFNFHRRALEPFKRFASTIPKFTNWREEKIKQAVANAAPLDSDALSWLNETFSATNVHRIIARCSFMHPNIAQKFESDTLNSFWRILEVGETSVVDIRHGLCIDLLSRECNYWSLLPSMADTEFRKQMDEVEYKNYSRITENVISANYVEILKDAIKDDFKLPLTMWHCFLARASEDDEVARHIITSGIRNIFDWNTRSTTNGTETAHFQTVLKNPGEPAKWKFDYLFRYFSTGSPHYSSSEDNYPRKHYLLVAFIYRNLTSPRSLIADEEQKQKLLSDMFNSLHQWLSYPTYHFSHEDYLFFFEYICCVDAFWSESMTDTVRSKVFDSLSLIWSSGKKKDNWVERFYQLEFSDPSSIYQWCSHDVRLLISGHSLSRFPIFTLLLMPQNHDGLYRCINSSNDPAEAVSRFLTFLQNFKDVRYIDHIAQDDLCGGLLYLCVALVGLDGLAPSTVLYNSSVLVELGGLLLVHTPAECCSNSEPCRSKLHQLHGIMVSEAHSEENTDLRQELEKVARKFRQCFGLASQRSQHPPSVENQRTETTNLNHDSEERGQPQKFNENEA